METTSTFYDPTEDPTYEQRRDLSKVLNLPYVGSFKQLQFHTIDACGLDRPVLYGGAMGGGKSSALCAEAIRECVEVPNNRVLMARLEGVTFKNSTLQTLLTMLPENVVHKPSVQVFHFPNGSQLRYTGLGTEKERQKIRSTEFGAVFIDEATEIDWPTFLEVSTRLRWAPAARAGRLKMRLTCNPEPGWIKQKFVSEPVDGYSFIRALPDDNPGLDPSYKQRMKAQLPAQWFAAYMMGDWDAFSPMNVVLPANLVEDAMHRRAMTSSPHVWGLDVARFGDDRTVLCDRRGSRFTFFTPMEKQSVDTTVDAATSLYFFAHPKPDRIIVDDEGVGGGVTDGLRRRQQEGALGAVQIVGAVVNRAATDAEHYYNLKAELWFRFLRLLQSDDQVELPGDIPDLKIELTAHRYDMKGGRALIEPKVIVKERLGHSPDYADALILTMHEAEEMYVGRSRRSARADQAIKDRLAGLPQAEREAVLAAQENRRKRELALENFTKRYGAPIRRDDGLGY